MERSEPVTMERFEGLLGDISISTFDYELPKEKIAVYPLDKREESKLLVYREGKLADERYSSISKFINPGSLVVFNESKVVQARLLFSQENGTTIELFALEPGKDNVDIQEALKSTESVDWRCLVGDLRKWKDEYLTKTFSVASGDAIKLNAQLLQKEAGSCLIRFTWNSNKCSFADILEAAGKMPLPPYIKREAEAVDKTRYQTVFAKNEGSVAAPTAGLHFTPQIIDSLRSFNIEVEYITLHVGAGTFKPVKSASVKDHEMHGEQIVLKRQFLEKLLKYLEKEVVAVGTTSARTLESLYWMGVKLSQNQFEPSDVLEVSQWDPYRLKTSLTPAEAIQHLLTHLNVSSNDYLSFKTSVILVPGYSWKVVKVLATNFHQPKSTLILLIASFVGDAWRNIYRHALENDYRFLSYGDGSLLFRE